MGAVTFIYKGGGRSTWGLRRRKRPILPGFTDRKRAALLRAAVQRYAWEDHERVPVRTLARYAAVSVATFYDRFGSRRAFWYAVVAAQFQGMTRATIDQFELKTWVEEDPRIIIRSIVESVVAGMNGETIGITRMAIRMTMTVPKAAEPFLAYREAITERAIELLEPKIKLTNPKGAVRQAMRMILAIAGDTSWLHNGPLLKAERASLIDQLSGLMVRSLGLRRSKLRRLVNRFATDDAQQARINGLDQAIQINDLPIYGVDLKAYEKAVNLSRKPEVKLSGPSVDPEDALVLSIRDQKPRPPNKRIPKRKQRFRLL